MKDKHKKGHHGAETQDAAASHNSHGGDLPSPAPVDSHSLRLGKDCNYEKELSRLQVELVKLQEWIRQEKLRVVVLFEGRDAAARPR